MRKSWGRGGILAASGSMVLAVASAAAGGAPVRAAIEAASGKFMAALARGDAAELASFYSAEARVFPPNAEIVHGKDAIQKLWQGVIDAGIKEAVLTTLDVEARGDLACEIGTYVMKGAGGKVVDSGKYVVVWKRENKQWKVHRDIWNTSLPASP
jgi:ketosteroid isomerase-like protein